MAASSSSGVRNISKEPQVFINFGGEKLRKAFIGYLKVALEEAKINILHERVGTKLQNLLTRIEQSMKLVALVIFSKDYTNSVRCLDELVKIKECIDKDSLTGIPIFYKLEISVVRNLEGDFGDNFRELQRKHKHDLVKTQKWEEALTFISQIEGLRLSENSDQPDIEFIKSVVEEIKNSLGEKTELVPKAEEMDIQNTVGLDTKVEMAWESLMNDERRILGLYGMGGVGKTTLLTCINNKFIEVENEFDVVIWVVVSKDFQKKDIQDQILGRLSSDKEWRQETENEKASLIKKILERKKFVLLLDDLWSEVDLNKIGVPIKNGSKIVFTTRLTEVCKYMNADEQIKVDCLSPDKAWELFRITVGEIPLKRHQDIPTLARKIVEKCYGLPLALIVIGKAMACTEDVREWYHAIDVLNSASPEIPDMEEKVLCILKFSYDSLKGDEVKRCFRYCSLFPEDFEIEKERLIEYWIGEGFIKSNRYESGGTNKGYAIIGLLVRAHLLIDCELKTKVKMHDVIRGMALWIDSTLENQQEAICVKSGTHVRLIPNDINWEILRRMSLMKTRIKKISCSPNCPKLSTLLLPENFKLADISVGFFRFMSQLVVLDLSKNMSLRGLPEEISNLASLQYLNLSNTEVKSLPVGLKNLEKLIYLNLEGISELESLDGIATTLPNLQVLKLMDSGVWVDEILMEEVQLLEHLEVLTVSIKDTMILERIQGVDRLARSIRGLSLKLMSQPHVKLNTVALGGLQRLNIGWCNIYQIQIECKSKEGRELSPTTSPGFNHLSDVYIASLEGQKDLSWLLYAQNLRKLNVVGSKEIEEIINKEKGMSITKELHRDSVVPFENLHRDIVLPFENLESLRLVHLHGLREICWNYPHFPKCKRFHVSGCPKLPKEIANFGRDDE